jgi:hypothetical protein
LLGQNSPARQIVAEQLRQNQAWNINKTGGYSMESSEKRDEPVPFMRQMLRNNMLMLTVLLGFGAAAYFIIGIFMLIGR